MTLLDKIAKADLTSVTEFHQKIELSDDEKLGLRELFESKGWDTLTNKLWSYQLKELVIRALVFPTDQRFYQGMFMGYKRLVDLSRLFEKGFDKKTAEELFDNFDDPTGYDLLH